MANGLGGLLSAILGINSEPDQVGAMGGQQPMPGGATEAQILANFAKQGGALGLLGGQPRNTGGGLLGLAMPQFPAPAPAMPAPANPSSMPASQPVDFSGSGGLLTPQQPTGLRGLLGSDQLLGLGLGLLSQGWKGALPGWAQGAQSDQARRRQTREDAKEARALAANRAMASALSQPGLLDGAPPAIRALLPSLVGSGDVKDALPFLAPKMMTMSPGDASFNPYTGAKVASVAPRPVAVGPDTSLIDPTTRQPVYQAPPRPMSDVGRINQDATRGFMTSDQQRSAITKATRIPPDYGPPVVQVMGPDGQMTWAQRESAPGMPARPIGGSGPKVSTFYDQQTGAPYRAQWNPSTNSWDRVGGLKQSSGGGVTAAQKARNAEIDAARGQLQPMLAQHSMAELGQMAQPTDELGDPNPHYRPGVAKLITRATSRKVGDDPDFESTYSNFFGQSGGSGEPAPAPSGRVSMVPNPVGGDAKRPPGMNDAAIVSQARQAIQAGKDPRAVAARLQAMGVNPSGLQ